MDNIQLLEEGMCRLQERYTQVKHCRTPLPNQHITKGIGNGAKYRYLNECIS